MESKRIPKNSINVAGEISCILSDSLPEKERRARLELLRTSAYHAERFDWEAVRNFHFNVMLSVERGDLEWGDSVADIETNTLLIGARSEKKTSVSKREGQSKSGNASSSSRYSARGEGSRQSWWCPEYQRGTCSYRGAHELYVRGSLRWVDHFCASCWQEWKQVRYHPESSRECPAAYQL